MWFLRMKRNVKTLKRRNDNNGTGFRNDRKWRMMCACNLLKTYLTGMQETAREICERINYLNITYNYIQIFQQENGDIINKPEKRFHP